MSGTDVPVKAVGLFPAAAGVEEAAFARAWKSVGAPPVAGLRDAVALDLHPKATSTKEATAMWAFGSPFPFAAMVELRFTTEERFIATRAGLDDFYAEALDGVLAPTGAVWMVTTENVVVDGPDRAGLVRAVFFPHRLPGMRVADFQRYWRTRHAAIVPHTPHLARYVQAHAVAAAYEGGAEPFADGIAELWWHSTGELEEALVSDAFMVEQAEDAANFVDPARQTGTVLAERPL